MTDPREQSRLAMQIAQELSARVVQLERRIDRLTATLEMVAADLDRHCGQQPSTAHRYVGK